MARRSSKPRASAAGRSRSLSTGEGGRCYFPLPSLAASTFLFCRGQRDGCYPWDVILAALAGARMPRGPRLDAPGTLHHVMARGIERSAIFRDDADRNEFIRRLGQIATVGVFEVFAWALMPNHFHLLLKTGLAPLSAAMRSLLTGHAIRFNRRHDRAGHVFQNRYRSIVCEEE